MTDEEHQQRHEVLHAALDELLACWRASMQETTLTRTVGELLIWSHQQTEQALSCPETLHAHPPDPS